MSGLTAKPIRDRLSQSTLPRPQGVGFYAALKELKRIMWDEAGILRNQEGLVRAREAVQDWYASSVSSSVQGEDNPKGAIELSSAARVALLIIEGALRRQESRGAHFREDFPEQNDKEWRGHLQVRLNADGDNLWEFEESV